MSLKELHISGLMELVFRCLRQEHVDEIRIKILAQNDLDNLNEEKSKWFKANLLQLRLQLNL